MKLVCRAPLRIDLAGGWSDIPPFAEQMGGAVLNAAIDRYVTGELIAGGSDDPLAAVAGLPAPPRGMSISYRMDLPSGNGLGSSAALSVAWLALVRANMKVPDEPTDIAALACQLGSLLGIMGGKQDEYCSAVGGFNLMRFGRTVEVERLSLSPNLIAELEARLVLVYSGTSRLSGDIHDHVWGAYEHGSERVGRTLTTLRDTALAMRDALVAGDLEEFGRLLDRNWQAQLALHSSITNSGVEALFKVAQQAGAQSGKACGAGGGGCLVFFTPAERTASVQQALAEAGAEVIPFHFDHQGVQVSRVDN